MENKKTPIMPFVLYALAAVMAIGSYMVYAGRKGYKSWDYFLYMDQMYWGTIHVVWLLIIVFVIGGTVMLCLAKFRNQLVEGVADATGSNAAVEPSKADEIAKLKKLLDSGTLTAEEFETEKKKILEK